MKEFERKAIIAEIKKVLPQKFWGWHRANASPTLLAREEHDQLHEFSTEPDRETFEKIKALSEGSEPE
jgi:hypothetical protein